MQRSIQDAEYEISLCKKQISEIENNLATKHYRSPHRRALEQQLMRYYERVDALEWIFFLGNHAICRDDVPERTEQHVSIYSS